MSTIRSRRALLYVHGAVLLFGASGLFGKTLDLPATTIVIGRTFFATLALAVWRRGARASFRQVAALWGLGALLAAHWVLFFRAVQESTVAVGLLTFASFPIFVTILEPIAFRTRPDWRDFVSILLVTAGLCLVVPPGDVLWSGGALWGVASGATFAVLQIANRFAVRSLSPVTVALLENASACAVLLVLFGVPESPSRYEVLQLVALGTLCTALSHTLFVAGLRALRTQVASVVTALEPVYGIVLAALLLGERPGPMTLAGGAIILLTTMWIGRSHSPKGET